MNFVIAWSWRKLCLLMPSPCFHPSMSFSVPCLLNPHHRIMVRIKWHQIYKRTKDGAVAKSYQTLCDPLDCSLLGSSVHGVSQEEYWSGLPFPSPGGLADPQIKSVAPALQVNSSLSEPPRKPHQTHNKCSTHTSSQPLSLKKHLVILSRVKGNSWKKEDILVTYSLHFPIADFSIPLKT